MQLGSIRIALDEVVIGRSAVQGRSSAPFLQFVALPPAGFSARCSIAGPWNLQSNPYHFRAIYGTGEPFTAAGGRVTLSLSSTWGRADQQTSRDSLSLGRFVLRQKPGFPAT